MVVKLAVLSMVTMLVFTGCERRISSANIDVANRQQEIAAKRLSRSAQVKEGLTLKEVESMLGQPKRVETEKRPILVQKNLELTRWFFEQDGKRIELVFVDGNLQRQIPHFGETPEPVEVPRGVVAPGALGSTVTSPSTNDTAR